MERRCQEEGGGSSAMAGATPRSSTTTTAVYHPRDDHSITAVSAAARQPLIGPSCCRQPAASWPSSCLGLGSFPLLPPPPRPLTPPAPCPPPCPPPGATRGTASTRARWCATPRWRRAARSGCSSGWPPDLREAAEGSGAGGACQPGGCRGPKPRDPPEARARAVPRPEGASQGLTPTTSLNMSAIRCMESSSSAVWAVLAAVLATAEGPTA